jgi:Hint domain/Lipase (class 3)
MGTQSGTAPSAATGLTLLLDSRDPSLRGTANWLSDGFFAQAFEDVSGNIIISFEGSIINPLKSSDASFWTPYAVGSREADVLLAAGIVPQAFFDADTFASDVKQYLAQQNLGSNPIYLTGHSLGGAEAQDVAYIIDPGQNMSGVTFGAPGDPTLPVPVSAPYFINYVDPGDPVGNFGNHFGSVLKVGPNIDAVVLLEDGPVVAAALFHPLQHYAADIPLINEALACFFSGTNIMSERGEVQVQHLKTGDLLRTVDDRVAPISWIGRRKVSTLFADPLRVFPIRIKKGAIGKNVPSRDLLLSPDHAILINDVLIQAGALVNGTSIIRETNVPQTFTYYHVELDDHSLILAENTPAETFIDNVDRLGFDNWKEHEALYPDGKPIVEMPYPRAKAHRQVPRSIREQLAERGAALCGAVSSAA